MDWERTVNELGPRLFRYFVCSFPSTIAEDLVQEVLIRLVNKVGIFDSAKGTLTMFAFGIAHNVRLEALRNMKKEAGFLRVVQIDSIGSETVEPGDTSSLRDDALAMRKALLHLSEVERQIVLLHIDEFLTLATIAQLIDLPVGTVKSHLHRAKAKLREILCPN